MISLCIPLSEGYGLCLPASSSLPHSVLLPLPCVFSLAIHSLAKNSRGFPPLTLCSMYPICHQDIGGIMEVRSPDCLKGLAHNRCPIIGKWMNEATGFLCSTFCPRILCRGMLWFFSVTFPWWIYTLGSTLWKVGVLQGGRGGGEDSGPTDGDHRSAREETGLLNSITCNMPFMGWFCKLGWASPWKVGSIVRVCLIS